MRLLRASSWYAVAYRFEPYRVLVAPSAVRELEIAAWHSSGALCTRPARPVLLSNGAIG